VERVAELAVRPDELAELGGLFAPGLVADPYPAYRSWREQRPVARPDARLFVVSRFADCEAVLADGAFGNPEPGMARPFRDGADEAGDEVSGRGTGVNARSLLVLNPPDHTRLRRLVSRAFTPARVRALAPHVEAITAELVSGFAPGGRPDGRPGGRFDVIAGLALPLPVRVICELFGIPPGDRQLLVSWSAAMSRALDPGFLIPQDVRVRVRAASGEFSAYLRDLLPARRRHPGDDLISALIAAHDAGDQLTEDELIGVCMLVLIAGHETTRSLIGAGVLALLRHPGELALLAASPAMMEPAVEEVLRYDPPVQLLMRYALRDAVAGGITVPAGSFVLLLLGAANRDPGLCADPDEFSVGRQVRHHLAFGHGIHFCLGAPLARLEASVALRQLLPLLPRLRIVGDPEWKPNTVLRGLEHLWLEHPWLEHPWREQEPGR
jgi:cytochrome P450